MFPGPYSVSASDSVLAREGIARVAPRRVILLTTGHSDVELEYYPRATVFQSICPTNAWRPGTGVLSVRVVDSLGAPVSGARVEVATETANLARVLNEKQPLPPARIGVTDARGRFMVCGANHEDRLVVRAIKGSATGGIGIARWGDEFMAVTIPLRSP
jgi:hypothetical protein